MKTHKPTNNDHEYRITRLEVTNENINQTLIRLEKRFDKIDIEIQSINSRFDSLQKEINSDFKFTIRTMIFFAIILCGIMARGFHWV